MPVSVIAVAENKALSVNSYDNSEAHESTIITALIVGNTCDMVDLRYIFEKAQALTDAPPGTYWVDAPSVMLTIFHGREEGAKRAQDLA